MIALSFKLRRLSTSPSISLDIVMIAFKFLHRSLMVFVYFFSWTVHTKCYLPDGTDSNVLYHSTANQPCNSGNEFGMCCAINRVNPDVCRSDGLCQSRDDGNVWRDGCTDPSWKSSNCIKLCNRGIGMGYIIPKRAL